MEPDAIQWFVHRPAECIQHREKLARIYALEDREAIVDWANAAFYDARELDS